MTVLWAKELSQHGIRVAGIAPGFTATEMVVLLRDDVKDKFVKSIPIRRLLSLPKCLMEFCLSSKMITLPAVC